MGKKNKKKIDVFQPSMNEKSFLYQKFLNAKSINDTRRDFIKTFPHSVVPSEQFIHKMFLVFQKQKYRSKDSNETVNNNNNIHSGLATNGLPTLIQALSSKTARKRRKNRNWKKNKAKNRTPQPGISQPNQNGIVTSDNIINRNKIAVKFDSKINKEIPIIVINDNSNITPDNGCTNQTESAQGNVVDDEIFSNETVILERSQTKDINVKQDNDESSSNSCKSPSSTLCGIRKDVSQIFQNLKLKRTEGYNNNKHFKTANRTIKKKKILQKGKREKENAKQIKNTLIVNNNNAFPVASTPYKGTVSTKGIHKKMSISPIQPTNNQFVQSKENQKTMKVPQFQTILEISDDEDEAKEFVTLDKTGFSQKNLTESVITLDDVSNDATLICPKQEDIFSDVTLIQNVSSADIKFANTDLPLFSEVLKKSTPNELVNVCYDLTGDDDLSLTSLGRKRQRLLESLAKSVVGESFQSVQKIENTRNFGSNIYNPNINVDTIRKGLRMIVIDGSNVAMAHGMKKVFSVEGLKICIDYFLNRGHEVKAFVPRFRCKMNKSSNPRLLRELEEAGIVVFTPSREVRGRLIVSYDDRFIVQCAAVCGGVIVSCDNYRDLLQENQSWRETIEERLLHFTWIGDLLYFAQDPMGRYGPDLKTLLSHPS